MAAMNEHPLARFEARIAGLVEGAFAQVFGGPTGLQAVVASLSSALDEAFTRFRATRPAETPPHRLVIRMHGAQIDALQAAWPGVEHSLSRQIAERQRLTAEPPEIAFVADNTLEPGVVVINTALLAAPREPTGVLPRVRIPAARLPAGAMLISDGGEFYSLAQPVLTLGRAPDCSIMLSDPYVSRLHAQIRLRGQHFVLLDAGSHSGTFVNEARIHEHRLSSGDVLRLGRTLLIYQDQQFDETQATQPMPPPLD